MNYIAVKFRCQPFKPLNEIVVARLAELGFESFEEREPEVLAYITEEEFKAEKLASLVAGLSEIGEITFASERIADQNWNAEWEKSYPMVVIEDQCIIRAPFHTIPEKNYPLDILINPQMSFGTGHHETTYLVMKYLLGMNFTGKSVLDMGSGTGVLAIAAAKMGAERVVAVDNEDWAYQNTRENCKLNTADIIVQKGEEVLQNSTGFDIILANINKNILLQLIPAFAKNIKNGGCLILSGFFVTDVAEMILAAEESGFKMNTQTARNSWAALKFEKIFS